MYLRTVMFLLASDYSVSWPDGTYTLLQPSNGCPPGFSTGHRVWYPEHTGQSTFSVDNNLQGYANHSQIAWHFCTKIEAEASDTWPAGNYCILRNGGTCPTGFSGGSITFDEDDSAPSSRPQGTGTLPDGNYNTNSKLYFCCKNDGSVAIQATFPRSTPFILYPYTVASCQLVSDMTDVPGYTFFDSEPNGNVDDSDGSIPYTTNGPPTWYIHHCYYH
ncbi:uncharacterized protein LOC132550122 [Ylistrum balloti]|uniref:uncharacterized protein LOC132550122 n=1 Tax=Ylistrum balloti TaxID=509963 RepID=UPI002905E6EB|nr:uncharacterized protein LOC132550122 [Ylistrum balloti]